MSELRIERETKAEEQSSATVVVDEFMKLLNAVRMQDNAAVAAVLPALSIVEDTLKKQEANRELKIEFDEAKPSEVKSFTLHNMTWKRESDGRWINDHKEFMLADVTADAKGNLKIERKSEDGSTVTQDINPNGETRTVGRDKSNHLWYELVQDSVGKTLSFKAENGVLVRNGGGVEPKLLTTMSLDKTGNLVVRRPDETDVVLKPNGEQKVSVRATDFDEKTRYSVTVLPREKASQMVEIKDPNGAITSIKQDKDGKLVSARVRCNLNDNNSGAKIQDTKDGLTYINGRDSLPLQSAVLKDTGTIEMIDKTGTKKICLHPDGSTAEHTLINAEKGIWKPTSMKFGNGGTAEYKWDDDGTLRYCAMQSSLTGGKIIEFERSVGGTFRVYESINGKPSYLCCTIGVGVSAGAGVSFSAGVGESLPHQDTLRGMAVNERGEPTLLFLPQTVETLVLTTATRVSLSSSGSVESYRSDLTGTKWILGDRNGELINTKGQYFSSLEQMLARQAQLFEESACQLGNEASRGVKKAVDKGIKDFDKLVCTGMMLDPGLKLMASTPVGAQVKKAVDNVKDGVKKTTEVATPVLPEIQTPEPVAPRPLAAHLRLLRDQDTSAFLKDHADNDTPGDLPNGTGRIDIDTPRGKMQLEFEKGTVVSATLKKSDGSVARLRRTTLGEVQEEFDKYGKLERFRVQNGTTYKQVLEAESSNSQLPVERRMEAARILINEPKAGATESEKLECLKAMCKTLGQAPAKERLVLAKFVIDSEKQVNPKIGNGPSETAVQVIQDLALRQGPSGPAQKALDGLPAADKVRLMNSTLRKWQAEVTKAEEDRKALSNNRFAQDPVYQKYAKSIDQADNALQIMPNLQHFEKTMDALLRLYDSAKDDPGAQKAVLEAYRTASSLNGLKDSVGLKSLSTSVGEIANQKFGNEWNKDPQKRAVVAGLLSLPGNEEGKLNTAIMVLDSVGQDDPLWISAGTALVEVQYSQASVHTKAAAKARLELLAKK